MLAKQIVADDRECCVANVERRFDNSWHESYFQVDVEFDAGVVVSAEIVDAEWSGDFVPSRFRGERRGNDACVSS